MSESETSNSTILNDHTSQPHWVIEQITDDRICIKDGSGNPRYLGTRQAALLHFASALERERGLTGTVRKLRAVCDKAVGLFNRGLLCGKNEGEAAQKHLDIGNQIMDELFAVLEQTKEFDA